MAMACERSLAGFNGTALFGLAADTDSTKASEGKHATSKIDTRDSMMDVAQDDPVQGGYMFWRLIQVLTRYSHFSACKVCTLLNREFFETQKSVRVPVKLIVSITALTEDSCTACGTLFD
jgi:hypothetical protein